jgi:cytochrome c551/c552
MKAPDKFRDDPCPPIGETEPIGTVDVARAKDIIERVGCPQCHAFVQKKTGPPFKRVFEKVKGNPSCVVQRLKKNKEHNDEGVTDDLKGPEFKIVADYLATRAK